MIVAATGHRPDKLGGYGANARLDATARYALDEMRPSEVIVGMALGWDQAVARAAADLRIPFTAAIPFKGQESVWPYVAQRLYNDLLAKADTIVIVCTGGYAQWKMQKRNEWMVEHAGAIAALWNGSPGGTANCLEYARALKRPIRNFWNQF